jgi:uroporphyrinogen decarboxylase
VGDKVALQGNLDPNVLFAPPEAAVRSRSGCACWTVSARRSAPTGWDGHVFNLGHGISQHTPPEHVARRWSRRFTAIRGVCATPASGRAG